MKRYYYITVIAIVALLCLQVSYVENLYRDYIEQKVFLTQDALELSITKELHLRSREQNQESSQFQLYIKAASDMTPQEREKPEIINPSRKKRIAAGCGMKVEDVNRLLRQFEQMQKMMKQLRPGKGKKRRILPPGMMPPM